MKLSTVKLPASVISGLYSKSLVELNDAMPEPPVTEDKIEIPAIAKETVIKQGIQFLGGNKKNILVVVNYKDVIYLPDEELDLLTNMLTACKLSIADVAIINLNKIETPSYKKIINELHSEVILLFGTEPSALELPVDFPHFQVQSFSSYTFLYTPPLENIKNDKVLKSKLWVCLRRIFNV